MNKWPRCKDCVRDNYLREPVCQTCVAGSNFLPRGRSKIYYESVQEMNQPPAAYRAMVQALRRFDDSALVPEILDVMFNEPATIVFWADGTKTVVKAVYDEFDPEKGLLWRLRRKLSATRATTTMSLQSGRTSILRKRISDAPWPSSYMTTSSKR